MGESIAQKLAIAHANHGYVEVRNLDLWENQLPRNWLLLMQTIVVWELEI